MRTLVLSALLLFGTAFAQNETLPANPAFDQPVSIVSIESLDLEMALTLLGDTIGYQVIAKSLPEQTLNYDLSVSRPFREAWNLLTRLYDLDYVVQDSVILVAPPGELAAFSEEPVEEDPVDETYEVENTDEVQSLLSDRFVDSLTITSIPSTDLLLITATPSVHDEVRAFITEFDARITAAEEANAVETASRLFEVAVGAEQISDMVTNKYPDIEISTLAEIGAINVKAPTELMPEIEAYLRSMEQMYLEMRPVREAYRINNAKATDITGAITSALEAQGVTNATVAADERTNTIILVGDQNTHEIAQGIIGDLDTREEQVKIRVRIQEISQTEMDSLGVNLSGGVGTLSADILATGMQLAFNPSEVINALTLNATLDTLQEQSLSRNIDDVQIVALNNNSTTINSGGSIEIAIQGEEGLETQSLQFGTNVSVTPQITDDDFITLDLDIGLSSFDGELSNLTGLQFNEKRITTTVQIEDGDVLVLGGLIKEAISVSESGAPILKDLPVIGTFFRTSSNRLEESELIIVLEAQIE